MIKMNPTKRIPTLAKETLKDLQLRSGLKAGTPTALVSQVCTRPPVCPGGGGSGIVCQQ